jgi:hypothetical protein
MTTAQMQACVTAITNAGYDAEIHKQPDGTWKVRGKSNSFNIPVASADNLAISQSVTGLIAEIEYS